MDPAENKENEESLTEYALHQLDSSRAETSLSSLDQSLPQTPRVENENAVVEKGGVLDLSHLSLTHLSRKFRREYEKVVCLVLDGNDLNTISQMDMFKSIKVLFAKDNSLRKISPLIVIAKNIEEMILSGNQIHCLDKINEFHVLKLLDLSFNPIGNPISIKLPALRYLDLSSTDLSQLPNLEKCSNLEWLKISNNKIETISQIEQLLPKSLMHLDIANNLLGNLAEFSKIQNFESLENLSVEGNPCVFHTQNEFDPRIYLFSLNMAALKIIDGEGVAEMERIKAEWILTRGKARCFDTHEQLVEYMIQNMPRVPKTDHARKVQEQCMKKLRNLVTFQSRKLIRLFEAASKRQHNLEIGYTEADLIHTPKTEEKEKKESSTVRQIRPRVRMLNFTESDAESRASSGKDLPIPAPRRSEAFRNEESPSENQIPLQARRMISPPRGSRQPLFQPRPRENTIFYSRTSSQDSSETIVLPARDQELDSVGFTTPSILNERSPQSIEERVSVASNIPQVCDVSYAEAPCSSRARSNLEEDLMDRIGKLEDTVRLLIEQNEHFAEINDSLASTLVSVNEKYQKKIDVLESTIRQMIPRPRKLVIEKDMTRSLLKWELPVFNGVRVIVNDRVCGTVLGTHNLAKITELAEGAKVAVQIIGPNGMMGELSDPVTV